MAVIPGTRLGRYEILAPLGSGGMGDVYRARDPRLGRDVAIKVLHPGVSNDPDRLHRFEQEARATGMLNHPNILAIYDIGAHHGAPYLVAELLEGETVRVALERGPLTPRKAIEQAVQIARGLDAAHRKGIVHRDLKPENLFVTLDGRVEILDFGLAKLTEQLEYDPVEHTGLTTRGTVTRPGMLLGSIGYIAPEQVRGGAVDQRADIFALGAVIYEMVAGRRAFDGESPADVMSAILMEDPPELSAIAPSCPRALAGIVRRCLEKRPEERFHSAHDLALALESLSVGSQGSGSTAVLLLTGRNWSVRGLLTAGAGLVVVALASGWLLGTEWPAAVTASWRAPAFSAERLTFRRGWVSAARFAPEERTVLYSASWEGGRSEIFLVRPGSSESRSLGMPNTDLLSVSPTGEMAIQQRTRLGLNIYHRIGTLSRVPFSGGAPRELLHSVRYADWSPEGNDLAVVRDEGDKRRLEYPVGRVLYETPATGHNTIVDPRVSPDGSRVAFFEGVGARVTRWSVSVVDRSGVKTTLSPGWHDWWSLAWSPDGSEVWFAASDKGSSSAIYAVDLKGRQRVVTRMPGTLELHDVSRDGHVLAGLMTYRTYSRGSLAGAPSEVELSWLDGSAAVGLSRDGALLLLDEHGEGGGPNNVAYVRRTDGSPAVRLGQGRALALSPDGRWALAAIGSGERPLVLLPTGAGESRSLDGSRFEFVRAAAWFPEGTRVLLSAAEPRRGIRLYVQALDGGAPRAITAEGYDINGDPIAPDGRRIAAVGPGGRVVIVSADGGEPQDVPGATAGDTPVAWSADARALFVFRRGELPARLFRVDLASGARHLWKTFMPPDPVGVGGISSVLVTPDGANAIYSYEQTLSELYLLDGLR